MLGWPWHVQLVVKHWQDAWLLSLLICHIFHKFDLVGLDYSFSQRTWSEASRAARSAVIMQYSLAGSSVVYFLCFQPEYWLQTWCIFFRFPDLKFESVNIYWQKVKFQLYFKDSAQNLWMMRGLGEEDCSPWRHQARTCLGSPAEWWNSLCHEPGRPAPPPAASAPPHESSGLVDVLVEELLELLHLIETHTCCYNIMNNQSVQDYFGMMEDKQNNVTRHQICLCSLAFDWSDWPLIWPGEGLLSKESQEYQVWYLQLLLQCVNDSLLPHKKPEDFTSYVNIKIWSRI